jgi:hypothetical protein
VNLIIKNYRLKRIISKVEDSENEQKALSIQTLHFNANNKSFNATIPRIKNIIIHRIKQLLEKRKSMKIALVLNVNFMKKLADKTIEKLEDQYIKSRITTINNSNLVEEVLKMLDKINTDIEEYEANESGWGVNTFNNIKIESYQTKVSRGSSYIKTPDKFSNSRCGLINIQNEDQECFRWCLKYHQSKQKKNDDRISVLKNIEDKYNYEGIEFPVTFDDITKFEDNNQVCIFVYYIDDDNNIIKEEMEILIILIKMLFIC